MTGVEGLEGGGEAEKVAAGRGNGAGGEEAGEIEDVEAVGEVLCVGLQAERAGFLFVEFDSGGGVDGKCRLQASVGKIYSVENLLAVFSDGLIEGSSELEGQATAVGCAPGQPQARS